MRSWLYSPNLTKNSGHDRQGRCTSLHRGKSFQRCCIDGSIHIVLCCVTALFLSRIIHDKFDLPIFLFIVVTITMCPINHGIDCHQPTRPHPNALPNRRARSCIRCQIDSFSALSIDNKKWRGSGALGWKWGEFVESLSFQEYCVFEQRFLQRLLRTMVLGIYWGLLWEIVSAAMVIIVYGRWLVRYVCFSSDIPFGLGSG